MNTQELSIFAGGTKSWWVPGENPPCLCALSGTRVERRPADQCRICMGYIRRLRAAAQEVHNLEQINASLEARINKLNDDTREMKGDKLPMRYLDEFLEDISALLRE